MIERISSSRGVVCGLALDHRDSLRVAARRHGYPDDASSLRALKVELVRALAPFTTVVLLDVELGLDAFTERGDTPLVVPLEAQGYESLGEGRITTLLGDVDPLRAVALGAIGCKLLLPYRPDLADTARRQEEMVARVVADCRAAGVLSIIEPIVYGEVPELGAAVAETARRLARLGPDVLNLQRRAMGAARRRHRRANVPRPITRRDARRCAGLHRGSHRVGCRPRRRRWRAQPCGLGASSLPGARGAGGRSGLRRGEQAGRVRCSSGSTTRRARCRSRSLATSSFM